MIHVKAGAREAKCGTRFEAEGRLNEWLRLGLITLAEYQATTMEEINEG